MKCSIDIMEVDRQENKTENYIRETFRHTNKKFSKAQRC